ncbi:MAG: hypothetical protein H6727_10660 [Myxococcales bacterium]|nr:hypothetical protein [Myxococcales bacterium]
MMQDWRKSYEIVDGDVKTVHFVPSPLAPHDAPLPTEVPSLPLKALGIPQGAPSALPSTFPAHDHYPKLMIDTIHDGAVIPSIFWDALLEAQKREDISLEKFEEVYASERDWGADLFSSSLVQALNRRGHPCPGHVRINIARVLMDFGRFPGNTPSGAEHLERFAINYPFSKLLDYDLKKQLLETYYDNISDIYEDIISNQLLKIAIHTYDRFGTNNTERPLMSIITRPLGYQIRSKMPQDFFDPMYPHILAEYTADRKLTYRLSLHLEKAGIPIAHNYPYYLPDGSIEVRSQVWFFFHFLQQNFLAKHPQTRHVPAYKLVWKMLLDTNLRSAESENLRSYLHMFRRAPENQEELYDKARDAYREIEAFLHQDEDYLVKEYRNTRHRPSSLGIEVRKDYLWEFADKECRYPVAPREDNAQKLAEIFADALMIYFDQDHD